MFTEFGKPLDKYKCLRKEDKMFNCRSGMLTRVVKMLKRSTDVYEKKKKYQTRFEILTRVVKMLEGSRKVVVKKLQGRINVYEGGKNVNGEQRCLRNEEKKIKFAEKC